jgi:DsbC/DsbD-like thiol-disulfide interchange protein
MKKILLIALLVAVTTAVKAQILHPVKWSYAAKRTGKQEALIFFKATIEPGWHIYSQTVKAGGPVKTSIVLNSSPDFEKLGYATEPRPKSGYDKTFAMTISVFESSVTFRQKIKLYKPGTIVSGTINYMVCNDKQCLPPDDVPFSVTIN